MKPARHTGWAHIVFRPYLHHLVRCSFHSVQVLGELPPFSEDRSVLLLPNHSTWWDGFIIYLINDLVWQKKPFVMMEEKQLDRFPFFNRLGAYSVRPGDREDVEKTLAYSARLLENPRHLLFLFPQGKLLPWHQRPLTFKAGFSHILSASSGKPDVFICGIRTEFLGDQRPDIFIMFRKIENSAFSPDLAALKMDMLLQEMENSIIQGETGHRLFTGRQSPGSR